MGRIIQPQVDVIQRQQVNGLVPDGCIGGFCCIGVVIVAEQQVGRLHHKIAALEAAPILHRAQVGELPEAAIANRRGHVCVCVSLQYGTGTGTSIVSLWAARLLRSTQPSQLGLAQTFAKVFSKVAVGSRKPESRQKLRSHATWALPPVPVPVPGVPGPGVVPPSSPTSICSMSVLVP